MKNSFDGEVKIVRPDRIVDERGFFSETWNRRNLKKKNIDVDFVQDNHSFSSKSGTLRGLHFQYPPHAQAKLVRCVSGAIFDVVVDIRQGSPNYGQWHSYIITAKNGYQVFIPIGFAHGFITLEPKSEIIYKCSEYYEPNAEGFLNWNDPELKIHWPNSQKVILSKKDAAAPPLKELESPFNWGLAQ